MQLRNARLCLDCEEVHDVQQCPLCASETFAFITRWVPTPDRRGRPRAVATDTPETLDTYRLLLEPEPTPSPRWKLMKRGAVGLALFGVAGLVWRRNSPSGQDGGNAPSTDDAGEDRAPDESGRDTVTDKR
jgi:hypothetical protein